MARGWTGRPRRRTDEEHRLVDLAAVDRDGRIVDLLATGEWTPADHRAVDEEPVGFEVAAALAAWRAEIGCVSGDGSSGATPISIRETTRARRPDERPVPGARRRRTSGPRVRGAVAAVLALVVLLGLHTLGSSYAEPVGLGPPATTESHQAADRVLVNLVAAESALSRRDLVGALHAVALTRAELHHVEEVDRAADLNRRLAAIEVIVASSLTAAPTGPVGAPPMPPSVSRAEGTATPAVSAAPTSTWIASLPVDPPSVTGARESPGVAPAQPTADAPVPPRDRSPASTSAISGSADELQPPTTPAPTTPAPTTPTPATPTPTTPAPIHHRGTNPSSENPSSEHPSSEDAAGPTAGHERAEHEGNDHLSTEGRSGGGVGEPRRNGR